MPAASKNTTPPSIGTHGGGQHAGSPPPAGGGGGAACNKLIPKKTNDITRIFFNFLCFYNTNL